MRRARQFPSSSSDAVYTALFDTDTGASSCNCKGWIFKRHDKPRGCKHTKALEAELGAGVVKRTRARVTAAAFQAAEAELEAAVNALWTRKLDLGAVLQGTPLKVTAPKLDV